MTEPRTAELEGLDPYDLIDAEAARVVQLYTSMPDDGWKAPSRCEGWTARDLLAHLASGQDYFQAGLDDALPALLERAGAAGVTDGDGMNEWGIRSVDGDSNAAVLDRFRTVVADTSSRMRARDGGTMGTTVGQYPVRFQAFHLACELAIHADDVAAPVAADEEAARTDWRARMSRFAISEFDRPVLLSATDSSTRIKVGDTEVELPNPVFVEAAAMRLPPDGPPPDQIRAQLSIV
jgi:uncharacterized protein (TIGR03083 family)